MKNQTNKILVSISVFLLLLVLYEAFFIYKIKGDNKSISTNVRRETPTKHHNNSYKYKKDWFNEFESNSSFKSGFNDFDDFELYEFFNNKLIQHFKNELKSNFELNFESEINDASLNETESKYIASIAIPNMGYEKFDIEIKDQELVITGKYNKKEVRNNFYNNQSGSFKKIISLPDNIQEDKISSKYENGVLTIILPKRENGIIIKGKEINLI